MQFDKQLEKKLKKESIRYIIDNCPGLLRQKVGKDFKFYDKDGKRITSLATLKRIASLNIPPAWENVWICPSPQGHIQATGFDERGRKQYIYHPQWIKMTQEDKFHRVSTFAQVLPQIRKRVASDLRRDGLQRPRIIATVVWLLEHTFIRVGNVEYAKENDSFGLTTLRSRHVNIKGEKIRFEFKGKSNVQHSVEISHPAVSKVIRKCIELPGYELFQYVDEEGNRHAIDSADINEYLQDITGEEISAKDFRTWGATVLSACHLCECAPAEDEKTFKQNYSETVKKVAAHLRNTASVCQKYYIHPAIAESYKKSELKNYFKKKLSAKNKSGLTLEEYCVASLLNHYKAA